MLRPVQVEDTEQLCRSCWGDVPLPLARRRIERLIDRNRRGLAWGIVAIEEDNIVGFGHLSQWGTGTEICDLVVAEGRRGEGIGTALINHLLSVARHHDLREIEIGAAAANERALVLYRRLGFEEQRRVLLELGNGPEEVIYLSMALDEAS